MESNKISLEDYNLITGEGLAVEEYQIFKDELKSALGTRLQNGVLGRNTDWSHHWRTYGAVSAGRGDFKEM